MPSSHLIFQDRPALYVDLPDDGLIKTIQYGNNEHEKLTLQLGNHILTPDDEIKMSSAVVAKAKKKRGRPHPLCVTVRHIVPTDEQREKKNIRSLQAHRAKTMFQIETALKHARGVLEECIEDPSSNDDDLSAAALRCRYLTNEGRQRQGVDILEYSRQTTTKEFVISAGVPTTLKGVPGEPTLSLYAHAEPTLSLCAHTETPLFAQDAIFSTKLDVPAKAQLADRCVDRVSLAARPCHMVCHGNKMYVTNFASGWDKLSVVDAEAGFSVTEWDIKGSESFYGITADDEHLYVTSLHTNEILMFDLEGKEEKRICLTVDCPSGLAIAGGLFYVGDTDNHRVQVFNLDGTWVRSWGSDGDKKGQFLYIEDIALHDGEVFVTDNNRVQVFDLEGKFRRAWRSSGASGITVHDELVYVSCRSDVQVFYLDGTPAGRLGTFKDPSGICVDNQGRLWVCDPSNTCLQVFQ